jgi:peptide/nickel transport system permease protein
MLTYIVRRLILIVVVLFGLSVLTFAITRVIPADPVRLAAGPRLGQGHPALRAQYGYDKPPLEQYVSMSAACCTATWAVRRSSAGGRPDLPAFFPATLELCCSRC